MRNKCKHIKPVILLHAGIRGIKVEWCPNCGATRYSEVTEWHKDFNMPLKATKWSVGKWKSPKIAIS